MGWTNGGQRPISIFSIPVENIFVHTISIPEIKHFDKSVMKNLAILSLIFLIFSSCKKDKNESPTLDTFAKVIA